MGPSPAITESAFSWKRWAEPYLSVLFTKDQAPVWQRTKGSKANSPLQACPSKRCYLEGRALGIHSKLPRSFLQRRQRSALERRSSARKWLQGLAGIRGGGDGAVTDPDLSVLPRPPASKAHPLAASRALSHYLMGPNFFPKGQESLPIPQALLSFGRVVNC